MFNNCIELIIAAMRVLPFQYKAVAVVILAVMIAAAGTGLEEGAHPQQLPGVNSVAAEEATDPMIGR